MTQQEEKIFIKRNRKELNELFSNKIGFLVKLMLESDKENRDKYADSINILRDWLRELEIIEKNELPKNNSFV